MTSAKNSKMAPFPRDAIHVWLFPPFYVQKCPCPKALVVAGPRTTQINKRVEIWGLCNFCVRFSGKTFEVLSFFTSCSHIFSTWKITYLEKQGRKIFCLDLTKVAIESPKDFLVLGGIFRRNATHFAHVSPFE